MRIGTAGWTIPRELSEQIAGEGTHLQRYAQTFSCAEINTSFYRSHRESTWRRWADSVPRDFRFSVKAPKLFTHVNSLKVASEDLRRFLDEAGILGDKFGPLLFQLPPKLVFDADTAKRLLADLRKEFGGPVAFEPRHSSWFATEPNKFLQEFQVARVAADPAITQGGDRPGGFPGFVYYRLHGSPRKYYSSYSDEYLSQLAKSLRTSKAREKWCIYDNTASGAALGNALKLRSLI